VSEVRLIPVTRDNVRDVCQLSLKPGQDKMVAPAAYTAAEAPHYGEASWLRAIERDGRIVGVLWVLLEDDELPAPYLVRFMVDAAAQHQGVGRIAIGLLFEELRAAGCRALELSYVPVDGGAEGFWLGCGFEPTGREQAGETVVRIDL
jgi:diamine N-acetyltransferase